MAHRGKPWTAASWMWPPRWRRPWTPAAGSGALGIIEIKLYGILKKGNLLGAALIGSPYWGSMLLDFHIHLNYYCPEGEGLGPCALISKPFIPRPHMGVFSLAALPHPPYGLDRRSVFVCWLSPFGFLYRKWRLGGP